MSYQFEWTRLTMKDLQVLSLLAEMDSALMFPHFCKMLEKTGVDLDSVPVSEMPKLIEQFANEMAVVMKRDRSLFGWDLP